jgi:hypothetical protein
MIIARGALGNRFAGPIPLYKVGDRNGGDLSHTPVVTVSTSKRDLSRTQEMEN